MFKSKDKEPVKRPTTTLETEEVTESSEEYLALAAKLAIQRVEVDTLYIKELLLKNKMIYYSLPTVEQFLHEHCPARKEWKWYPVTSYDEKRRDAMYSATFKEGGHFTLRIYSEKIPFPVLNKIDVLTNSSTAPLIFMVNHYDAPHPDPFLAVATCAMMREGKVIVIDHWDEPTFQLD